MDTLVTRYRPTQFKDVIGQAAVIRSLKEVLGKKSGRTLLFAGPSGTGKTTLARIVANQVGCTEQSDIQEIDAATFTGIDDMRQITQSIQFRPLSGRPRMIIVDECHGLSRQAWDSLLKALEEPPAWLWWSLCTTNQGKVPQAVQTRCIRYDLKPVPKGELFELLEDIAKAEGLKVADAILDLCAKEAQGSPRAALSGLAACAHAKDATEARTLLRALESESEGIDLARSLLDGASWSVLKEILAGMKEANAEGVRHVVRAFMTSVLLGSDKRRDPERVFAILEAFSQPFNQSDGVSPLVLAVGRLCLGGD